jgi:hypothetical protein
MVTTLFPLSLVGVGFFHSGESLDVSSVGALDTIIILSDHYTIQGSQFNFSHNLLLTAVYAHIIARGLIAVNRILQQKLRFFVAKTQHKLVKNHNQSWQKR